MYVIVTIRGKDSQIWQKGVIMKRVIRVKQISLSQLNRLIALGFVVVITGGEK